MKQNLEVQGGVNIVGMRQEPRIVEQQFGNFQNPKKVRTAKAERRTFGRFFFRFPNGEAGLDVYNRVSSFLATLARDLQGLSDHQVPMDDLNVLIVTHGLTLRLLLMRYFQLRYVTLSFFYFLFYFFKLHQPLSYTTFFF